MVILHRPPMLTAKMLATADIFSRGRVTVGIGAGCMEEKINLLGVLTFKRRGKLVYETLAAMRTFWTDADPVFEGEFVSFSDLEFELKPVQKQHLPIWVGGEAKAAHQRAGQVGYPVGNNPSSPKYNLARFAAGLPDMCRYAEDAGRNPETIEIALNGLWFRMDETFENEDGQPMPFTGSDAAVIDDISAYG